MLNHFACGTFHREEEEDDPYSYLRSPRKSRSRSHSKNPYSTRGLDEFYALLADLDQKRQQIYSQMRPQDISIVRFVSSKSNTNDFVPIIVKVKNKEQKHRSEELKVRHVSSNTQAVDKCAVEVESTGGEKQPMKKQSSCYCWNHVHMWRRPSLYLPVLVIFILALLTVCGRSFATLCTCILWYIVTAVKDSSSSSSSSTSTKSTNKKKHYTRGMSEKMPTHSEESRRKLDRLKSCVIWALKVLAKQIASLDWTPNSPSLRNSYNRAIQSLRWRNPRSQIRSVPVATGSSRLRFLRCLSRLISRSSSGTVMGTESEGQAKRETEGRRRDTHDRERERRNMGLCFGCFGGGNKRMTKEEERLASEEARARAAEAAQKRGEGNLCVHSLELAGKEIVKILQQHEMHSNKERKSNLQTPNKVADGLRLGNLSAGESTVYCITNGRFSHIPCAAIFPSSKDEQMVFIALAPSVKYVVFHTKICFSLFEKNPRWKEIKGSFQN
ncbi:uncharacterized protein G2W53_031405 [Senna tora]|uniref:Uncharacterized protein n=1 Tax=Senna tora TaxID=362788 RepID=A0A834T959_9FABA|nr:uncharacterized protein G2W53_031405 [Senna tora]